MALIFVMALVAGVGLATAREAEPSISVRSDCELRFLVVSASPIVRQWVACPNFAGAVFGDVGVRGFFELGVHEGPVVAFPERADDFVLHQAEAEGLAAARAFPLRDEQTTLHASGSKGGLGTAWFRHRRQHTGL
jgi:hypothetical protein